PNATTAPTTVAPDPTPTTPGSNGVSPDTSVPSLDPTGPVPTTQPTTGTVEPTGSGDMTTTEPSNTEPDPSTSGEPTAPPLMPDDDGQPSLIGDVEFSVPSSTFMDAFEVTM